MQSDGIHLTSGLSSSVRQVNPPTRFQTESHIAMCFYRQHYGSTEVTSRVGLVVIRWSYCRKSANKIRAVQEKHENRMNAVELIENITEETRWQDERCRRTAFVLFACFYCSVRIALFFCAVSTIWLWIRSGQLTHTHRICRWGSCPDASPLCTCILSHSLE